jgi:hypothetical protein
MAAAVAGELGSVFISVVPSLAGAMPAGAAGGKQAGDALAEHLSVDRATPERRGKAARVDAGLP